MSVAPARPDQIGSFAVDRELGRGGMGVVYLATQTGLNRKVALKVLDPRLAGDPDFAARFAREAVVLASLESAHVITVYDHGSAGDYLYLATQYVDGGDLHSYLERSGPLPTGVALDIFGQVIEALGDTHARGVVHRDIKPSNILLRGDRAEPYVYLCDFGIAQELADTGLTRTGLVTGSVAYMPPERHSGRPASEQSDLYSAGCLLWRMVTGQPPYSGTEVQVAMAHVEAPIPQLPGTGRETAALNRLLAWTLAKDPDARPRTAAELLVATHEVQRALVPSDPTQLRSTVAPYPAAAGSQPNAVNRREATQLRSVVSPAVPETRSRRSRRFPVAIVMAAITVLAVVAALAVWIGWPKVAPAATAMVCWDGSHTTELDSCSSPTTVDEVVEYLRYVYPNQDSIAADCTVTNSTKHYSELTVFRTCRTEDGVDVVTRYWTSGDDARKLYDERFEGNTRASYDFYIGDTKTDGWVKTTKRPTDEGQNLLAFWGDEHLVISVFAQSSRKAQDTLEQLEVVVPEQVHGYPEGDGGASTGTARAR